MLTRILLPTLLALFATSAWANSGNIARISIIGSENGAPGDVNIAPSIAALGIAPGSIIQNGSGNVLSLSVYGDRNVFALRQDGSNNFMSGTIIGQRNQVAARQTGNNNVLTFYVRGVGNILSIRQNSR